MFKAFIHKFVDFTAPPSAFKLFGEAMPGRPIEEYLSGSPCQSLTQSIKIIALYSTLGAAPVKPEAGDKVRVKTGGHAGKRGVVESIDGEKLLVLLEESAARVRVTSEQITNYSLAARKAWVTGPDRAVGRRKGTKLYDRISVTLRFDRDVWEQFLALEDDGTIDDRIAIINGWFREKMAELDRAGGRR